MVDIETILVRLVTASSTMAGTDGDVYLGIDGREFCIDSLEDDFEIGQDRTYILGKDPSPPITGIDIQRVINRPVNDPQSPYQLKTENLYKYPVYIRFEPEDRHDYWVLELASVFVNPRGREPFFNYIALEPPDERLYLGTKMGKYCYLHRVSPPVPASLPDGTRGL